MVIVWFTIPKSQKLFVILLYNCWVIFIYWIALDHPQEWKLTILRIFQMASHGVWQLIFCDFCLWKFTLVRVAIFIPTIFQHEQYRDAGILMVSICVEIVVDMCLSDNHVGCTVWLVAQVKCRQTFCQYLSFYFHKFQL